MPRAILSALIAAAAVSACGAQPAASPTAKPATPTPTPVNVNQVVGCPEGSPTLTGVSFGDTRHGLISGGDAFLWQTGDDGKNWSVVVPPDALHQLSGVLMTDGTHVWIWGDLGMYSTVAGSGSWVGSVTHLTGAVVATAFTSGSPLAAIDSKGALAVTADGGTTWKVTIGVGAAPPLHALTAPDAKHLTAVGDGGTVVSSSDGGATWVRRQTGVTVALRGVWFTDAKHGWAVGDHNTLIDTADGGLTWKAFDVFPVQADLDVVTFLDADHGWVGGKAGTVLYTTDGGATWKPAVVTDGVQINAISFQTPDHGWAVGRLTGIYESTDGGATWTRRNACL